VFSDEACARRHSRHLLPCAGQRFDDAPSAKER
jgi:hypothetical protein